VRRSPFAGPNAGDAQHSNMQQAMPDKCMAIVFAVSYLRNLRNLRIG
jgi:hypothetical protein